MEIPRELKSMLDGSMGPTKQKAARLVVDLASTAGASEFIQVDNAHVSGVSVITGGAWPPKIPLGSLWRSRGGGLDTHDTELGRLRP